MITLTNDFHGTSAQVKPAPDGTVSRATARRVWRTLCGVEGCTCGGELGERPAYTRAADPEGRRYTVTSKGE